MLVAFLLVVSLVTPLGVTAQDGDGDLPGSPDASADVVEQPPAPVETTSEPEETESLPEPDVIESESASEPEVTTEDPDPVPGTEEMDTDSIETETSSIEDISTDSADADDGEASVVWVNTDAITLVDGITEFTLDPGASQTIALRYAVTTPRTSTTIHAALIDAPAGWTLSTPNLVDDDPSPLAASWIEHSTVNPETVFLLPIVLTAPATVPDTHTVSLRVWSTATGTNGEEVGVAQSSSPILTATAVAPPIVNTDSVQLIGEANQSIASGESVTVAMTYNVTTPRQGTTVRAALVDEAGNTPEGWTLDASEVVDVTALTPGSAFTAAFTITAPEFVEVAHSVSLRIWSETNTDTGNEDGISAQDIANVAVAAAPAEPTIFCEPEDGDAFICTVDPDRKDAISGTLTVMSESGWSFTANGVPVPETGVLDLGSIMADGALEGSVTVIPNFGAGCADGSQDYIATVAVDYTYTSAANARAETSVGFAIPAPEPVAPSVSIAPLDFGTLTWNGESWGTAEASTTLTISRDGCGDLGAYDIQIQMHGDTPGFNPVFIGGASANPDIEILETKSDLNAVPATVARATSSFTGTAEITLEFQLTPGSDVMVGPHQKEISVTMINAP